MKIILQRLILGIVETFRNNINSHYIVFSVLTDLLLHSDSQDDSCINPARRAKDWPEAASLFQFHNKVSGLWSRVQTRLGVERERNAVMVAGKPSAENLTFVETLSIIIIKLSVQRVWR